MALSKKLLAVLLLVIALIAISKAQGNGNNNNRGRQNDNNSNNSNRGGRFGIPRPAIFQTQTDDSNDTDDADDDDEVDANEVPITDEEPNRGHIPPPNEHRDVCRGRWMQWSEWSECNAQCDDEGFQTKRRYCVPRPNQPCSYNHRHGADCVRGRGARKRLCNKKCSGDNTDPCPQVAVQGEWGEWGCWSEACLSDTQTRYRLCNNPWPAGYNKYCRGPHEEHRRCGGRITTIRPPTTQPTTFKPCVAGQDVIFAVDASGSIGTANFDQMSTSLLSLLRNFPNLDQGFGNPESVRTGIIRFASIAEVVNELGNFTLPNTIAYTGGSTLTEDAIKLAQSMFTPSRGDRSQNRNTLVILTDGESNDRTATLNAATQAKAAGIKIIAVGIGSNVDDQELNAMVSDSTTDVYRLQNFDQLRTELTNLFGCATP